MTTRNLTKLVKQELLNYDRYVAKQLKIIGYFGYEHMDTIIAEKMSFVKWLETYKTWKVIKIEGFESHASSIRQYVPCKFDTAHAFYHQRTGTSFKWHTDTVNVLLLVLQGSKIVHLKNRRIVLTAGQSILIPKGSLHKVFSRKGTIALSIGLC